MTVLGFLAMLMAVVVARAALQPDDARKLLATHQDSVVTLLGVLKVQPIVNGAVVGNEIEKTVRATGTVLDASGLVVAYAVSLNPVGAMIRKPVRTEVRGQMMELEMKTRIENLKIRLPDLSEVAARVVAEDEDLGLVLVGLADATDGKTPTFHPVNLDEAVVPMPTTQYVVLDRTEEDFKFSAALGSGMFAGVLTKPRVLYLQDMGRPGAFTGSAFYDLAGRFVGVGAMSIRFPDDPFNAVSESWPLPVVVAAADLRDFARRARKAEPSAAAAPAAKASTDRLEDVPPEKANALLQAWNEAVVVVEGSVKYNCGRCAEEHEEKINAAGLVLDAGGLVAISNDGPASGSKYLQQDLKYILADRSEVPARIILQDDDLLLTVLAPVEKADAGRFKPVELKADVEAGIFDPIVLLGRLSDDRRHLPTVTTGRVFGRVTKPRPLYKVMAAPAGPHETGNPIFLPDGRLLGITTLAPDTSEAADETSLLGLNAIGMFEDRSRVAPASALVDLLEQARAARAKSAGS